MRALILIALLIAVLLGCQKNQNTSPENGEAIAIAGPSNFGYLIIGDAMQTTVKLTNSTGVNQVGAHNINTPFIIKSATPSTCSIENVPANSACDIVIEFAPTSVGSFSVEIQFLSEVVVLKGGGSVSGTLSLDVNNITFSSLEAGAEVNYTVKATNIGGTDFWLTNLPDTGQASVKKGSCDDVILPGKSCNLNVIFTPKYASQNFSHILSISENLESKITFTGAVTPTKPAGDINIVYTNSMQGNSQQLITTTAIRDPFGNQVVEGTIMTISVGDTLSLKPNRSTLEADRVGVVAVGPDGTISFMIYSVAVASARTASIYIAYPDTDAYGTREITINP